MKTLLFTALILLSFQLTAQEWSNDHMAILEKHMLSKDDSRTFILSNDSDKCSQKFSSEKEALDYLLTMTRYSDLNIVCAPTIDDKINNKDLDLFQVIDHYLKLNKRD